MQPLSSHFLKRNSDPLGLQFTRKNIEQQQITPIFPGKNKLLSMNGHHFLATFANHLFG
jgi:hypothetical protein